MKDFKDEIFTSIKSGPRNRNPTFSVQEIRTLVKLIEKYKDVILNKSVSASACQSKELCWKKITKEFNDQGLEFRRSRIGLKFKWENLKRRMICKNIDKDIAIRLQNLSKYDVLKANNGTQNDEIVTHEVESLSDYLLEGDKEDIDETSGSHYTKKKKLFGGRSMNFTPKECSILLQCVRKEKHILFNKTNNNKSIMEKSNAWSRITNQYNQLSPIKRPEKALQTKFFNLKKIVKKANLKDSFKSNKHKKLLENDDIKMEPSMNYASQMQDTDISSDDDQTDVIKDEQESEGIHSSDPLSVSLNCHKKDSCCSLENKEVVRLKIELLKYKMETAKLERRRVEECLRANAEERSARALENSLRVRAARLAVERGSHPCTDP